MSWGARLRQAITLPPREVLHKAVRLVRREAAARLRRRCDEHGVTYASFAVEGDLAARLRIPAVDRLRLRSRQIGIAVEAAIQHRFDLLGSGPIQVVHGAGCAGLEGHRFPPGPSVRADREGRWLEGRINPGNLAKARGIWRLVDPSYVPIDWQLDFRSGWRWRERTWFREVRYGDRLGADVKVAWELARMQHLPALAYAFALARAGEPGFAAPETYAHEARNQVLDFVATNPPRFGVNWACPMDVALRAVSWIVAVDLLRNAGATHDDAFERVLVDSLYDHGRHIIENIEWDPRLRGNHYFADVTGVLFLATWLPKSPETDSWLAFAVQEIVSEIEYQFAPSGANFEGSTAYHRLSAEMAVWGAAVVLGLEGDRLESLRFVEPARPLAGPTRNECRVRLWELPGDASTPIPPRIFERLEGMATLAMGLTKPDGRVWQIGDDDSGRFMQLEPGIADPLDHRSLVGAVDALVPRDDFSSFAGKDRLDRDLVRSLSSGTQVPAQMAQAATPYVGDEGDWRRWSAELGRSAADRRRDYEFAARAGDLREGLERFADPDFGAWVFRSPRLFLGVRCGPETLRGSGGHSHNDQLSVELVLEGEDRIVDPGSYVYTPLPHRRNEYRSVRAHFAPRVEGQEPGRIDLGLFERPDHSRPRVLYFGPLGFVGVHQGYGEPVWRRVEIRERTILVSDWSALPLAAASVNPLAPSHGYGVLDRCG